VLTGDKTETAINIGFACDLISNDMALLRVDEKDFYEIQKKIHSYLENGINFLKIATRNKEDETEMALIVTGDVLTQVFDPQNSDLKDSFLKLGCLCKSVICCRVSPSQKSQ
jgi:magnesium-transporting ATPase (P-type)